MPFNQLFLVLLGGFIFVSQWRRTKFYARRVDGHRLIFFSAVAGIVFLLIAVAVDILLARRFPAVVEFWRGHVSYPHTGKAFIAFLLGATLWFPLNNLHNDLREIERVLLSLGGPFEILLAQAMSRRSLVMLKVKNENIYVGYVNRNFNPIGQQPSLEMTVVMRGYSAKDTREEVFNRFYLSPDELKIDPLPLQGLTVTLPISEVQSAQFFDADEYARRFEQLRPRAVAQVPQRPSYEAFSAEDHFELGKQYLLRNDFGIAGEQFEQAALKDAKNADYRFFLAMTRSIGILLRDNSDGVIHYANRKQLFELQLDVARSYTAGDETAVAITDDLQSIRNKNVFELLLDALALDSVKYKGVVQFIIDVVDETKAKRSDRTMRVLRDRSEAFIDEEMLKIAEMAKDRLINVMNACLKVMSHDPSYYQFVSLALARTDRIVVIDLLAETLIKKGEWEAAETVYMLPLKYQENNSLRASLKRVRKRQPPLN